MVTAEASYDNRINNFEFEENLRKLKQLREFVLREIGINPQETALGKLNILDCSSGGPGGRQPTEEEWLQVEDITLRFYRYLTPQQLRKFAINFSLLRLGLFHTIALYSLMIAVAALIVASISDSRIFTFASYLVWIASLGATGSVAFLATNMLSVQQDITFDLDNRSLVILRVILGSLFGLILALPVGFDEFDAFIRTVITRSDGRTTEASQIILLLLPFVLGFSTSLVMTILNRLVSAAQAVFGPVQPGASPSGTPGQVTASLPAQADSAPPALAARVRVSRPTVPAQADFAPPALAAQVGVSNPPAPPAQANAAPPALAAQVGVSNPPAPPAQADSAPPALAARVGVSRPTVPAQSDAAPSALAAQVGVSNPPDGSSTG